MSGSWSFFNPVALRFGAGSVKGRGQDLPPGRLLLVTTAGMVRRGAVEQLFRDLGRPEGWHVIDSVTPNPEVEHLESLRWELKSEPFSAMVAFGGGSTIDTAKVLSVLLGAPDDFDLRQNLEGNQPMPSCAPMSLFSIPTTAGTGAEVTPFATVWSVREGKKFSFASPTLFPSAAWLDPEYTASVSRQVTISTGLDAFSQALESIWNRNANAHTLMLAWRSAGLSYRALQRLVEWPPSLETRSDLLEASLLAGLSISHTRTALAHSMSYPLTAHYGLPHGLACGFTLPAILRYNREADDGRLQDLARGLGQENVESLATAVADLLAQLDVSSLMAKYLPGSEIPLDLVPKMLTPGRSDNNLRPVGSREVEAIFQASMMGSH